MYILEVRQLIAAGLPDTYREVKVSQQFFTEVEKEKTIFLYHEIEDNLPTGYRVDLLHIVEGHKVPITEVSRNG